LRESQERLSTLINAMPDIVCFKDGQGRWLEANDFALRLFRLEGVDYKGKKDSELAHYSPFYREAFLTCEETDNSAWNADGPSRGDETITPPDGPPMTFDIIKVPTFDSSGARKGLVVVGRDVTERKRIEKLLRLQRDLAMDLSSADDISKALESVLETSLMIDSFECGGVYLQDPKMGGFTLAAARGLSEDFMNMESFYPTDRPGMQIVLKGEPIYNTYTGIIERFTGAAPDGVRKKEGLSALAVIPFTHGGSVIGCLNLASRSIENIPQFSRDALESIGVQVGSVIGRLRAEQIIRESLAEKDMLLKEIHHRVKNNMQIISSLLQLQIYRLHDARDQELITNLQNSVRSMALVHERLYRSESMARIHMAPYIRDLTGEMLQFNPISQRVGISIEVDDVLLAIDEAVPCGLILNELVTNSLKHGFNGGRTGTIRVQFRIEDGLRVLIVRDDGAGIPDGVDLDNPSSLGMRLVNALVKQLSGTMLLERSAGTVISIRF
jgi:PAS domain S-box-containing protein